MNIEHLRDKFDLNELELALVKYLEDDVKYYKCIISKYDEEHFLFQYRDITGRMGRTIATYKRKW